MKPTIPWFKSALDEVETFFDLERLISEEDALRRKRRLFDTYHELFLYLVQDIGIKDEWDEGHCHMAPFSTGIIERSCKLAFEITLGVSMDTWFIEAPIKAPYCLRYMKDNYWAHIVRLSKLGKAELRDYGRPINWLPTEEARALVKPNCSLVFSIARDYALMAVTPEDCSSLGAISLTLPIESDENQVEAFYRSGIESLYKSNQMLVSADNARRNRMMKKYLAQQVKDGGDHRQELNA